MMNICVCVICKKSLLLPVDIQHNNHYYYCCPWRFFNPILRGARVNRTCGTDKILYIYLFSLTVFGPIYYAPPANRGVQQQTRAVCVVTKKNYQFLNTIRHRNAINPLRTPVLFWGQTTCNWSALSPHMGVRC